ncbi:MAG: ParB/RepB/Spo0J family partition protein [Akkermansiaceae bacterium]|nr:ParB/RepB/Spo0J family partition protein [Armatimonadota bacterium]
MSNAATVSSKTARPVLGRGLADLIPVGGNENAKGSFGIAGTIGAGKQPIGEEVPLTLLHPNPNQPRTHFDPAALAELSASIKQNGVLQPILVRPRPAPLPGYEIVAGERRYRAARDAGLTKVPVVIRSLSDDEALAVALIENLIRQDIGPLETARAYSRLMSEFGWTQEEMGKRVGKSRVSVANHLRLLKLPQEIQESVERGELSEGHARGLLGGEGAETDGEAFRARQKSVFDRTIEEKLTVRDVERMMRLEGEKGTGNNRGAGIESPPPRPAPAAVSDLPHPTAPPDPDRLALEDKLRAAFGTKVRVHFDANGETGRIELGFFSADELDGLTERLLR